MITDKEKRVLEYIYTQAENCLAFLRDNDLVEDSTNVSFTVSEGRNCINVSVSYFDKDESSYIRNVGSLCRGVKNGAE